MRFLKKKVQLRHEPNDDCEDFDIKPEDVLSNVSKSTSINSTNSPIDTTEYILPLRRPRQKPSSPNGNSKNIIKNYGKALCSFAVSGIATPYLENMLTRENVTFVSVKNFTEYIKSKKDAINSIESLRRLLIADLTDDQETQVYKKLFQEAAIIFLKYFSVNWIFGGKLMHKSAHLKFRFKMLRRVQQPEHFTYLKTIVK